MHPMKHAPGVGTVDDAVRLAVVEAPPRDIKHPDAEPEEQRQEQHVRTFPRRVLWTEQKRPRGVRASENVRERECVREGVWERVRVGVCAVPIVRRHKK